MSGRGSILKRCPCAPTYSAKGERLACKLDHGSWSFVVGVTDRATGKRRQIRQSGYATKAKAQAALAELSDQAQKGTVPARRAVTFGTFSAEWLAARSRRVRPVTALAYTSALNHAVAAFGAVPLSQVTRADVERLAGSLAAAGRSRRTSGLVLFVVRSVLGQALDDGLVVRNVAAKVEAVGRPPVERGALSAADMAALRAHVASDRLGGAWLMTLLGLRRSEVLGLRWSDVNTTAGTVSVQRGVVADAKGGRAPETPTKTRRGVRTLPLPPDVLTALRAQRDSQAAAFGFEQVRSGWLAVDEAGVPYRPERWSDIWRQHCVATGVEPVTLHTARHSAVSAMRAARVPDRDVAEWMGHDENVMRGTYDHPDAETLGAAGRALADVLSGGAR